MKRQMLGVVAAVSVLLVNPAVAQQERERVTSFELDLANAAREWMMPGEFHQHLDKFVGNWDMKVLMWAPGINLPPREAKGTCEIKWILGGRFIMAEHQGETMMPDPQGNLKKTPYAALSITGYDLYRERYVGTWMDSTTTQIVKADGITNGDATVFMLYGKMDEPTLNTHGRIINYVMKVVDENTRLLEIHRRQKGGDQKILEITYTRKKTVPPTK